LKPHLRVTIRTLLQGGASQRKIERATGVDRKTIRRYEREAKSPGVATGSEPGKAEGEPGQIPPRPPVLRNYRCRPSPLLCNKVHS
jgi:transposase